MLSLRRLLFPTDGSTCATHALAHAADLARRHRAELHVLHVRAPRHDALRLNGEAVPDALAAAVAGARPVRAEARASSPTLGILDYADRHDVDLIVMGTHGRAGVDRLILGSVTQEVVRLASCPVLTVRPDVEATALSVARILAPVDFSADSWLAVAYAEHLAALYGARLDLLHVVETLPSYGLVDIPATYPAPSEEQEAATCTALLDLAHEAGGPPVALEPHVVAGNPTIGVLEAVEALAPDLLVLPTHGRSGLKRLVLGSVAEQAVRRASCPVLVVRGQGRGLLPIEAPGARAPVAV